MVMIGWMVADLLCLPTHSSEAAASAGYNIGLEFLINSHSLSGLKVDVLKLFNESYKPYKGVRTMTKAGRYQVRA